MIGMFKVGEKVFLRTIGVIARNKHKNDLDYIERYDPWIVIGIKSGYYNNYYIIENSDYVAEIYGDGIYSLKREEKLKRILKYEKESI